MTGAEILRAITGTAKLNSGRMPLSKTSQFLLAGVGLSVALHALGIGVLGSRALWESQKKSEPVKVKIIETKKEEPKPEPPPPPPPKKEPPKPKPKPKQVASQQQPKQPPPKEPPKPIQGLDANSMDPNGKGVAAPMGNTMMMEDTGERAKTPPPELQADLSADAALIRSTIVDPKYTDAALDANLQTTVLVDVFVDENGVVQEVELKKKVGYGMDERIIETMKNAKFTPRKNKLGRPEAGWTEVKWSLEIP